MMIQTIQELIDRLEVTKSQVGPKAKVLRGDNSGGYEAIDSIEIEDAFETITKIPVKTVVLS
jgi:hypothetical protein